MKQIGCVATLLYLSREFVRAFEFIWYFPSRTQHKLRKMKVIFFNFFYFYQLLNPSPGHNLFSENAVIIIVSYNYHDTAVIGV